MWTLFLYCDRACLLRNANIHEKPCNGYREFHFDKQNINRTL